MAQSLLLDTNVLLAMLLAPQRLPEATCTALADSRNAVWFSAASLWEIAIKCSLDRADFDFRPEDIHVLAQDSGLTELPVEAAHTPYGGAPALAPSRSLRPPAGGASHDATSPAPDHRSDAGSVFATGRSHCLEGMIPCPSTPNLVLNPKSAPTWPPPVGSPHCPHQPRRPALRPRARPLRGRPEESKKSAGDFA